MRQKLILTLTVIAVFFLSPSWAALPKYLNPAVPIRQRVEDLMARMTLTEKIGQMNQYLARDYSAQQDPGHMLRELRRGLIGSFLMVTTAREGNELQRIAEESRLKIPPLNAIDAIHGHCLYHGATVYPTCIGMAGTFNDELVRRIHTATAREMRTTGYHWAFFPYLSVSRDPRWGRVGENFGEDPLLVSRMAAAVVFGLQGQNLSGPHPVVACAKVLIGDGQPINGLNGAPMDVSERTLREVFLPPAQACVDAGARTFMVAHNEINGVPCHANHWLLTEVLRREWGFTGYVISDWMDIERLVDGHKVARNQQEAVRMAVAAGVDIHMHGPGFLEPLEALVRIGVIPETRIDRAVREILYDKFRLGLFENRYVDESRITQVLACRGHVDLALETARQSIVLLKNERNTLPLGKDIDSILVTGPFASDNAILGDWVLAQPSENITTIVEGMRAGASAGTRMDYFDCGDVMEITAQKITSAADKARTVDVAVLVVGGNDNRCNDEGEYVPRRKNRTGGENIARSSIQLAGRQLDLVKAVHATGTPVVVVLINGRPLAIEWIAEHVPAVVEAWQPGMTGGRAVADVLFGKYNPCGRLPITIPRGTGHLLSFYNHGPMAYWRKYKYGPTGPLYAFGHGLSYTTFAYRKLQIPETVSIGNSVPISVEVTNTGPRAGHEVVMLFVNDVISSVTTPVRELQDYQRIYLEPGQTRRVEFVLAPDQLALYDVHLKRVVEPGTFEVMVADQKGTFAIN